MFVLKESGIGTFISVGASTFAFVICVFVVPAVSPGSFAITGVGGLIALAPKGLLVVLLKLSLVVG